MDDLSIIIANLTEADRLLWDSWLLRKSHLSDLAYAMHSRIEQGSDEEIEEEEELLTSLYGEFSEKMKETENVSDSDRFSGMLSLFTRVELCKALAMQKETGEIPLWEGEDPRIAYFHNPFAGRILHSMLPVLGEGEAVTAEDYTDACEGVADGRYDFCLLPIESARDGIMNRFVQMIARCDLFTVLTCRLEISEEEYIRFALLSAAPCCLESVGKAPEYLQVKVVTGEEQLWEFLFVAHHLGAKLSGCRPLSEETAAYELTLQVEGANRTALNYYLDLGWTRSTVTGFYREILADETAEQGILH